MTPDFNHGALLGAQYCATTVDPATATRSSAQTAFLDLCQARPNIKVFQNTLIKKIIFDESKRGVGVVAEAGLRLNANREIILSAGAFQSPQLLMVSGVGPAETLEKLNIPIIADRPGVGQNLEDHIMYGPSYRIKLTSIATEISDPTKVIPNLYDYFTKAQGPLTHSGTDFVAWEKLPRELLSEQALNTLANQPDSFPDIEYMAMDAFYGDYSSPLFKGGPKDGFNYVTLLIAPMALRSRGSVTIKSADTADLPIVDPNWLTDSVDKEIAVAGFKRARQLFASNSIKSILADPVEYCPGPFVETDQQILDHIRSTLSPLFHASATCKMGRAEDPSAVVDNKGIVYGVSGVRVVDTSSFAMLPSGHPQAMVYAFAEKMADEIKKLYAPQGDV
jgi:choline dehydrogenase-like flavoprotein